MGNSQKGQKKEDKFISKDGNDQHKDIELQSTPTHKQEINLATECLTILRRVYTNPILSAK